MQIKILKTLRGGKDYWFLPQHIYSEDLTFFPFSHFLLYFLPFYTYYPNSSTIGK